MKKTIYNDDEKKIEVSIDLLNDDDIPRLGYKLSDGALGEHGDGARDASSTHLLAVADSLVPMAEPCSGVCQDIDAESVRVDSGGIGQCAEIACCILRKAVADGKHAQRVSSFGEWCIDHERTFRHGIVFVVVIVGNAGGEEEGED